MKWVPLNDSFAAVGMFNLVENNSVKEVLRYHRVQQSVRVSGNNRQRVYFMEQAGFRNSYYVFKNEYGFETGRIHIDNSPGNSGFLDTGKTKILYAFQQKPLPELVLYEEDGLRPKIVCSLQQSSLNKETAKTLSSEHACLLWGLYWYLHGTAENGVLPENKVVFAG